MKGHRETPRRRTDGTYYGQCLHRWQLSKVELEVKLGPSEVVEECATCGAICAREAPKRRPVRKGTIWFFSAAGDRDDERAPRERGTNGGRR